MVHSDANGCCCPYKTTEESWSGCVLRASAGLDDWFGTQLNGWTSHSEHWLTAAA